MENEKIWVLEDEYEIHVNGTVVTVRGEIKVEDVIEAAKTHNIAKFVVKDVEGNLLTEEDFPFRGNVYIEVYNEAACHSGCHPGLFFGRKKKGGEK